MLTKLKVKNVVTMDFQEPYSVGLSGAVDQVLKKAGVNVTHLSAPNTTTDYSAYVTKVPSNADIVFFPTQKPGDAQTFAQQLLEQGKKAKVFGGDGSNDPTQFKVPGSYVSNFAAPINLFAYNKPIIAGWMKANPGKPLGSFGPPTYGAIQIILQAVKLTCAQHHGVIQRRDVFRNMKKVKIKNFILGGNFTTDYSAYVTKVPNNADVVSSPRRSRVTLRRSPSSCSSRARRPRSSAVTVSNDPTQFKVPGSYVSNFAAPINLFAYNKPIIAGWMKANPGKPLGSVRTADLRRGRGIILQAVELTCAPAPRRDPAA